MRNSQRFIIFLSLIVIFSTIGIVAQPTTAQEGTSISIDSIPDSRIVAGEEFNVHVSGRTDCYVNGAKLEIYEKDWFGENEVGNISLTYSDLSDSDGHFDTTVPTTVDEVGNGEMELQARVKGDCIVTESARSNEQTKPIFEADTSDPNPEFLGLNDDFRSTLEVRGVAYVLDSDTLEPENDFRDEINPGDEITLSLYVNNTGGNAGEFSTIQTQFPEFKSTGDGEHVEILTIDNPTSQTFRIGPGETVFNPDGSTGEATSWQTEASIDSWGSGAVQGFTVTVTPQEPGYFTIYVRSTLTDDVSQSGSENQITEPEFGEDDPDQNYQMEDITIPVSDGDSIPINEDQCRKEPEDSDGYEDSDGCPENPTPVVSLDDTHVSEGDSTTLTANANNPEGESLSYDWSLDGPGSLSENGDTATYEAPPAPAGIISDTTVDVSVTVTEPDDQKSATDTARVSIADANPKPTVSLSDQTADEGGEIQLQATANNPENDGLSYSWSLNGPGQLQGSGESASYTAPTGISSDVNAAVSLEVREPQGKSSMSSAQITVNNNRGNDDPDGDGIPNNQDAAPDTPEDMDGCQDADGSPEPDGACSDSIVSRYDTNGESGIQISELNAAIDEYFVDDIGINQLNTLIDAYFQQL